MASLLRGAIQLLHLSAQSTADVLTELEHGVVRDLVADEVALLLPRDGAGGEQHAQMLRDVLLGAAGRLLKLPDGRRALAQAVEQPDPHRLAEHAKALCDQLDETFGKRVGIGGFFDMPRP